MHCRISELTLFLKVLNSDRAITKACHMLNIQLAEGRVCINYPISWILILLASSIGSLVIDPSGRQKWELWSGNAWMSFTLSGIKDSVEYLKKYRNRMIGASSELPSFIHNADPNHQRAGTCQFGLFLTIYGPLDQFSLFSSMVLEKCQISQNNRENIAIASITGITKIDKIW